MKFRVLELTDEKCNVVLDSTAECLTKVKLWAREKNTQQKPTVELEFDSLGLGTKLYGESKKETIKIQKENCKRFLKFFKVVAKAVKKLEKFGFDGTFFVRGLDKKKNCNDIMLVSMLEIRKSNLFDRFRLAYEAACDFLDGENALNNMCDFQDNRCTKHRAVGTQKNTGCCASFCKLRVEGSACTHKNLSCKIFMCDYLISKGYYFTPNTIPVLKRYFSIFERGVCFGLLCRTEKKAIRYLRFVRALTALYAFVIAGLIIWLLSSVM